MYLINCAHPCHCNEVCKDLGYNLLCLRGVNMIKKLWNKIVNWLWSKEIMSKKPLNISEEAAVQMPMKTVTSLDRHRGTRYYGLFWYSRKI